MSDSTTTTSGSTAFQSTAIRMADTADAFAKKCVDSRFITSLFMATTVGLVAINGIAFYRNLRGMPPVQWMQGTVEAAAPVTRVTRGRFRG